MRVWLSLSITVAMLVAVVFSVSAQEFRSTISGQVQDSQSAAVPAATITATNVERKATFTTRSGDTGQFTLPFLPPGTYLLSAAAAGFKRYTRENLAVTANQRISLDIVLEVGALTESVTVSAAAPLLTTATASIGQGIGASMASEMPMSGRTPLALARLAISVVDLMNPGWARPFDNGSVASSSMGGGRTLTNELLMDGSPVMYQQGNSARAMAYSPPLEAVEEVKTEVFQSDAAYGNTSSGTINVVTKSGTNQFHGSAEEYNQVSKLAATPFFYLRSGQKNPVTHWNQWDLTAGGPVVIPKVFNGSNKLFWFFAYEGVKDSRPTATVSTIVTVPTAAERKGDFSALLPLGTSYQIYDPMSAVAEGSRRRRQLLPGNIVPSSRISPIATNYMNFYPQPNQTGLANGQNNYISSPQDTNDYYNFLGRSDLNLSPKHKLSWSGRSSYRLECLNQLFLDNVATGIHRERENWGAIIDDVYGFSPSTWLNTRVSWNRFIDADTPLSAGYDATKLGFPQLISTASQRSEMPWITFSDSTQMFGGTGGGNATGFRTPYDTLQLFSTLNKLVGRHSLKFGADVRRIRESSIAYGNASGQFTFGTGWTNGPLDNSPGAPLGQALAAFMLGMPTDGGFDINAFRTNQSWYSAFFIQDDWHASNKLTMNLGLRYEHETPTTERYNRALIGFDSTTANGVTARAKQAYAGSPVSLVPASQFNPAGGPLFATSGHRNIYDTPANLWSPRIGVAYTPVARTVIRAGFGVFYQTYLTIGVYQPGFSQRTPFVASQDGYLTPYATLANPFPGGIQQPVGAAAGLDTNLGKTITFFNPNLVQPHTTRWTFSAQRELGGNTLLEFSYVGSKSSNLTLTSYQDLNVVPRNLLSTSPFRDQATINSLTANVANPFQGLLAGTGLNGSTTTVEQLARPFAQYSGNGSLTEQFTNQGYSSYNAFDIRVEKRLSSGVQFLVSYSFSKNMAAVTYLNPSDAKLERKVSSEDRPQRFVTSGSWLLPFGKGRRFGSGVGRLANGIIGGWALNGIVMFQVGGTLGWGNVLYYGGDLSYDPTAIDKAFDTSRFNTNSAQQLDRNVRTFPSAFGNLRTHMQKNLDLSLRKNFRIRERVTLQFALDDFNATNYVQFSGPNLNPTQAGFATVTGQANRPRALQMALRLKW